MKLKKLKNILLNKYSITIEDLTKKEDETWSSSYIDFKDIENEKLEKNIVSIDTWIDTRHANEKSYYIIIK